MPRSFLLYFLTSDTASIDDAFVRRASDRCCRVVAELLPDIPRTVYRRFFTANNSCILFNALKILVNYWLSARRSQKPCASRLLMHGHI